MIGWLVIAGWFLIGTGTARAVFARQYAKHFLRWRRKTKDSASVYYRNDPHWLARSDADVLAPTCLAGVFWPGALIWLLVLRPLGTIVFPLFGRWFMAPALRRVKTEVKS